MKKISFEIEHPSGDTYMGFELCVDDDNSVEITKTLNCSHADTDGDYLFNTDNNLIRIQADCFTNPSEYKELIDRFKQQCKGEINWF